MLEFCPVDYKFLIFTEVPIILSFSLDFEGFAMMDNEWLFLCHSDRSSYHPTMAKLELCFPQT